MPPRDPHIQESDSRPFKKACHSCGGDMTQGQVRRQEFDEKTDLRMCDELDSIYAHLRSVIEHAKTMDAAAIRHQLVGLLPEVQPSTDHMRETFPGLAKVTDQRVREAWASYGYPPEEPDAA